MISPPSAPVPSLCAMTTISARAGKSAPSTVVVGNERASASVASPRIPHHVSTTASRGVRGAAVTILGWRRANLVMIVIGTSYPASSVEELGRLIDGRAAGIG